MPTKAAVAAATVTAKITAMDAVLQVCVILSGWLSCIAVFKVLVLMRASSYDALQ